MQHGRINVQVFFERCFNHNKNLLLRLETVYFILFFCFLKLQSKSQFLKRKILDLNFLISFLLFRFIFEPYEIRVAVN